MQLIIKVLTVFKSKDVQQFFSLPKGTQIIYAIMLKYMAYTIFISLKLKQFCILSCNRNFCTLA